MGQRIPSYPAWRRARGLIVLASLAALLTGCGLFGGGSGPTTRPSSPAQIFIDAPQIGASLGGAFELRGRTSGIPAGDGLIYRIFDASEQIVGTGPFAISGNQGGATFATIATHRATAGGPGRLEVLNLNTASGAIQAIASLNVTLVTGETPAPGATAPPATIAPPTQAAQLISIETPAPGTVVGSPLVVTGRSAIYPQAGVLSYRVLNAAGAQIGAGTFAIVGNPADPATFNASLNFQVPPGPTSIRVEIFDQNPTSGAIVASSSVELRIGEPPPAAQAIIIETPPSGTFIASPVVLTGRTTQFPFQGNLAWLAVDQLGRQLGSGIFNVLGSPGQPTTFNSSLDFQLPLGGGPVRFEIYDQDAVTGATVARGVIDLQVAAPPPVQPTAIAPSATAAPPAGIQQIFIDTPPPNTLVGSPVVITGRTVQYPFGGQLAYRFRDQQGSQLGSGGIRVAGQAGGPGSFNVQLFFNTRPGPGQIFLDIFENGPTNNIVASATIALQVDGGPQPLPSPSPTPQQPQIQPPVALPELLAPIVFDTPPPDTLVGSPLVVTGRTNLFPNGGRLYYQILDRQRRVLAENQFQVFGTPNGISPFNISIEFRAPEGGGPIVLDVFTRDQDGQPTNTASLILNASPPPYPAP
jgi:Immunoglobulin-like domain of bacterial spore germination